MPFQEKYYQWVRKFLSQPTSTAIVSKFISPLDKWAMNISSNKFSFTGWVTGLPMIMLTTIGSKSGLSRTSPLLGLHTEEGILIIASNFGQKKYPDWYHNLKENPDVKIKIKSKDLIGKAVEINGEKKMVYWKKILEVHPGYDRYKKRASHREIPVILIRPT